MDEHPSQRRFCRTCPANRARATPGATLESLEAHSAGCSEATPEHPQPISRRQEKQQQENVVSFASFASCRSLRSHRGRHVVKRGSCQFGSLVMVHDGLLIM